MYFNMKLQLPFEVYIINIAKSIPFNIPIHTLTTAIVTIGFIVLFALRFHMLKLYNH